MPHTSPQVQMQARNLVVLAYAHGIMEDVLTDYALSETPLCRALEEGYDEDQISELGMRFEETFLQGNAPQWSYAEAEGKALRAEALETVNEMLWEQWLDTDYVCVCDQWQGKVREAADADGNQKMCPQCSRPLV